MKFLRIALLIFVCDTILALNTFAISKGSYAGAGLSATMFLLVNFYVIQHVAAANSRVELAAYVVGGVAGDLAGIWLGQFLGLH